MYAENAQEVYDSLIQAFKIGENLQVLLPVMVGLDGFTLSHTLETVSALPDDVVKKFVGTRRFSNVVNHEGKVVPFKLDPANPTTMGPIALQDYYFEFKRQQEDAMKKALQIISQVHDEYAELSGRHYGNGLFESYRLEDAEIATVCLGSTTGTVKTVVDDLRAEGIKAGLLKIRTFRPFAVEEVINALRAVTAVGVMDRCMSFGGNGGPVYHEIRHALYDSSVHPIVINYIYGLGGRDTSPLQIRAIYDDLRSTIKTKTVRQPIRYVGLRE
jgi:pyruvate ferredoxin oxidoreductase alpha subunit